MSKTADKLVSAVIAKIKNSGLLESGTFMATVTAVNFNGTITVSRGSDTFPDVRLLSGFVSPKVGDRVEIMRTLGGWVCLGMIQSTTPVGVVDIRAGTTTITPSAANTPTSKVISFAPMQGNQFYGSATAHTTVPGTSVTGVAVTEVTSSSVRVWVTRSNTTDTNIHWAVFGVRN